MRTTQPKVSVCMITYNHEKYIKEAIEGVLSQNVDFDIELILANDCSTDETHDIISNILQTHPKRDLIRYFQHPKNMGMMPNFIFALEQCEGTYIALCEGDDYWTDPHKLKKQVDFLEKNPEYGICFHKTEQINSIDKVAKTHIPKITEDTDYNIFDYIYTNKTATCSIVYRKKLFEKIPTWFVSVPFGDLGLVLSVLKNSINKKGKVLKDTMAVYRMHEGGVHGSLQKNNKSLILAYKQYLHFDKIIEKHLLKEKIYKQALKEKKLNIYAKLCKLTKLDHNLLQYGRYKFFWYFQLVSLKLNK